jgi:hypothetical protein
MPKKRTLGKPAAELVRSLNKLAIKRSLRGRDASQVYRRLLRLIDLCRQYAEEARSVTGRGVGTDAICDLARQGDSAFYEITNIIKNYRYSLSLGPKVSVDSISSALPNFWYKPDSAREDRQVELATAAKILEAMQNGQLGGLRQCANSRCRQWFYSARRTQKFCPGGSCQKREWARSARGKAGNRKRQAQYYATDEGRRKAIDRQADRYEAREKADLEAKRKNWRPM